MPARALFGFFVLSLLSGCGYVHFGRLPGGAATDSAMAEAYSTLSTEHKILKQELVLARREGDALRAAVERAGTGGSSTDLVARLNETTRELATLRASYAKLQAERAGAADPGAAGQLAALEDKLAGALRNFTQLQEENSRLRADLDRARTQNTTLAEQLRSTAASHADAQSALAQLNTELIAQKEARARAEQTAAAVRAQLGTVLAAGSGGGAAPGTSAPPPSPAPTSATSALRLAKAPPADASGVAELRTSPERLRAAETAPVAAPPPAPTRTHTVQAGDTLEKIAQRYYGAPNQWHRIYDANAAQLGNGRPLTAGMQLHVPEN